MNRIASAFRAAALTLGTFARVTLRELSLVPTYLGHLLWLLSQEFRELTKEGYGGNSAAYACLRLLSASVAEPHLIPYARQSDGEPGEPLAWGHPLAALLRSPNPFLTEYEHLELLTLHLGIAGRYTGWKERDNAGRVIALWPLRPDRVGPIYGAAGEPALIGWSYLVPGTTRYIPIPAGDVLLVNFPDPMGESGGLVEGMGPLQVLAAEVSADNQATTFVGTLLANYATPGVVLQVPGKLTGADDAKLIKAGFMRDFGGAKRGEPAVLDNGTTMTPVGFSLQQLEFPNLRRLSESRICAAFGTPAILVGLLVGLESGIRATIEEQRAFFAETTLTNYWRRLEDALTNNLAVEFGATIVCRFDLTKVKALARQSAAELAQIEQAYSNGALTKNEYRDALGFEPRDDGDVYVYGIAQGRGTETAVPPAAADSAQPLDPATGDVPASAPAAADAAATGPTRSGLPPEGTTINDAAQGAALLRQALDDAVAAAFADAV